MKEIWKDIEEYEGLYQVSNMGRVRSVERYTTGKRNRRIPSVMLKLNENLSGYYFVSLSKNGVVKNRVKVHRLVAKTFLPNPNNKPEVNHLDCNPKNNCVTNLEWVTHKENMDYAVKMGRFNKKCTREVDNALLTEYVPKSKDKNFEWLSKRFGIATSSLSERYHKLIKNDRCELANED